MALPECAGIMQCCQGHKVGNPSSCASNLNIQTTLWWQRSWGGISHGRITCAPLGKCKFPLSHMWKVLISSVHTQSYLICCRKPLFLWFFRIAGTSLQSPMKSVICNVVHNTCFPSQNARKVILCYAKSILWERRVPSTCCEMINGSREQTADVSA